jgi:hypothetical protein
VWSSDCPALQLRASTEALRPSRVTAGEGCFLREGETSALMAKFSDVFPVLTHGTV